MTIAPNKGPAIHLHGSSKLQEHCSTIPISQNNKKSVSGMCQPLFVTFCCEIMGQ